MSDPRQHNESRHTWWWPVAALVMLLCTAIVRAQPPGSSELRLVVPLSKQVIDSRHARLPNADSTDGLLLVTCFPFNAVMPGGPLRYVVLARRIEAGSQPMARRMASISAL